jgi:hypothetical protein
MLASESQFFATTSFGDAATRKDCTCCPDYALERLTTNTVMAAKDGLSAKAEVRQAVSRLEMA